MKKRFFRNKSIFIYILSFLSSFIGIFLNFFLARILGASSYGRLQFLVAFATTCSQFMIFGLNTFMIREAKNKKHNGELFNKCLSIYLVIITFVTPIIFYLLNNYTDYTISNAFLSITVVFVAILIGINSLISAFFQGNGKYHLTILLENLIPKSVLLLLSILFLITGSINVLPNFYLPLYVLIYSFVSIPLLFKYFKNINFSISREDFLSITFFFGVTVTYSLGNNLTKVLQGGLYRNDVALAIISVSLSIVSLIRVFTSVLDNMIKPIFAEQKRNNQIEEMLETYRFDTRMNSYVSIPLYLFFILFPKNFLIIFGPSYTVYANILIIISVANAVSDITGPNGTMLAMTGKEKWELFNGLLYFGVYIAGIFIFSFDKIYGLCYSLLLAQIVVNIAKYVEIWLIYKTMPLNLKSVITLLFVIAINFAVIFLYKYASLNIYLWFLIGIFIGMNLVVLNCFGLSLYRKTDFKKLLSITL